MILFALAAKMLQVWLSFAFAAAAIASYSPHSSTRSIVENHGSYNKNSLWNEPFGQCKIVALPSRMANGVHEDFFLEKSPSLQLMQLALYQAVPQALKAFVDLGIPDILLDSGDEGFPLTELVERLSSRQQRRIRQDGLLLSLRILNTVGVVEEVNTQTFRLTAMGSLLSTSRKDSLDPMVRYLVDEPLWKAWGSLSSYIQQGDAPLSAFEIANKMPSHQYFGRIEHAESLKHANHFVRHVAEEEVRACVECFDWEKLSGRTVVDLGGHTGQVMEAVATQHPSVTCLCLDLPEVVLSVGKTSRRRVQLVGGNMFDPATIPKCDAIFMKHILLCDWDEENSRAILESCHKVLPPHGIVIVGESVLPSHGSTDGSLSLFVDAFMMLDGRPSSRTREEWESFARDAGFQVQSIQYTSIPTCSILVLQNALDSDDKGRT
jgi:O-methyltransferase domain